MHPQSTAQQTAIDLSHEGVDRILAALAEAGQFVHYNETDGDTFIDIWLTDLDADAPTVLGWRDSEGWQLRSWTSNDTDQPPARKWPIEVGSPADVARDVAAVFAKGEELSADAQETWFFTFGSGQQNDGKYVVIPGSYDEARNVMLAHFGNAWSFQYASPERAGVEEFGLVELPRAEWPTPAEAENPDEDDAIAEEIDQAFAEEAPEESEPDYWLTLADDLRQVADRVAGLAGTAAPTWVRLDIVGVAPQDASKASATIIDGLADVFGTEARTSDGGTVQRYGMGARLGVVDVNGYTYLPLEDSELERLRARVAELEAEHTEGGEPR